MADKKISALTGAATPLAGSEVLPIVQSGATVKVSVDNLTAGKTVNTRNIIATVADDAYALAGNATTGSVRVIPYVAGYAGSGIVTYSGGYAGYGPLTIDSSVIRFYTLGNERANIDATGNFNLGSGNVVIGTAGKGIDFSATTHAAGMTSELLNDYEEGTWTPAFNNLTVGNATVTGRYTKTGRIVTATVELIFGSTSAWTGSCSGITGLPFTTAVKANGCMTLFQTNVGWSMGQIFALAGQTQTSLPTNYAGAGFAAASPWVWTANDYALITLVYEAL
jgi:hypothetical protein